MLKRLSFRSKLLLVLFVPFLALVVIAAAGLRDRFVAVRAQEQYGEISGPMRSLDALARSIENEAVVSSWFVASGGSGSNGAPDAELARARARTDTASNVFRATEPRFVAAGIGPTAFAALERVDADLAAVRQERIRIDELDESAASARRFFLDTSSDLLAFGERVARDLRDPEVSAALSRTFVLQRSANELAREASIRVVVAATPGVAPTGEDFTTWVGSIAAQARYREQFDNAATDAERAAVARALERVPLAAELPTALPGATEETPDEIVDSYQERAATLAEGIAAANQVIAAASAERADAAQRDVLVYGGIAVLAMLLTLALIWFVTRAVARPVRELTEAARDLSRRQLPQLVEVVRVGGDVSAVEPTRIEVVSEDEIAELAQAFNDVQAVTFEVAQEQSRLLRKGMGDLFVNLARRNQSLLERQLELLDELERNEHDPAALDALFKLDHMATRMRRNAESLLVLSGAEQPRQWQQPIALLDVVRAAAAEIADFPRVELVGIDDDLAVAGRAVADVAHLVAELLENATSFSPPDSAVVVSGAATASGFVLAVSDQGIGMPPERIREANELLARPPAVGLALSRALGLHVVGSLAARLGITVELRAGAPVGLVALVTLPSSVLERSRADVAPAEPQFSPDLGADGEVAPLGARRVTWRPADEPPVEEWGRVSESIPASPSSSPPPPVSASPPPSPPPPPPSPPPPSPPPPSPPPPPPSGPSTDDVADGPLPTRVPGRHMSHQPLVDADAADVDADPLRPYRVHELLTRHDQGKRRGRAEGVAEDHAPEGER